MEEKANEEKQNSLANYSPSYNKPQSPRQKCLINERLKVMKSRIFWSRNNSDSSLQKIKQKLKISQVGQVDKLHVQREKSQKMKKNIDDLVNKLSLPKIRQTKQAVSMHINAGIDSKELKPQREYKIAGRKTKLQKRKSLGEQSYDEVLKSYNKRCEDEVGLFSFSPATIFNKFMNRNRTNKKLAKAQKTKESSQSGGYLPKEIVSYLKKYVR